MTIFVLFCENTSYLIVSWLYLALELQTQNSTRTVLERRYIREEKIIERKSIESKC